MKWDLNKLLQVNNIPPDMSSKLIQTGVMCRDFAAWILYAHSQEGRGIKRSGFFAAKRLLERPPILAQERWQFLVETGPGFVEENIQRAVDPIGEDVDREWGDAMGKVPRERPGQLARDLGLELGDS